MAGRSESAQVGRSSTAEPVWRREGENTSIYLYQRSAFGSGLFAEIHRRSPGSRAGRPAEAATGSVSFDDQRRQRGNRIRAFLVSSRSWLETPAARGA